jgi:hypothetical protein
MVERSSAASPRTGLDAAALRYGSFGASHSYLAARFASGRRGAFQCAEFLLLRNRGFGPLAVTVLPIPFAGRAATTACAAGGPEMIPRALPIFTIGYRQDR